MNRKIFYVDCYYEEEKERNIGFVKLEEEGIFVMLRGLPMRGETVCKIYAITNENNRKYLVDVPLNNGYGQAQFLWSKGIKAKDCREIYIPIDQKRHGSCIIEQNNQKNTPDMKKTNIQTFRQNQNIIQIQEPLSVKNRQVEQKPIIEPFTESMPVMEQDKWKQLCKNFPQVHIFPEADTIVIKPKDMIILTQEYHELATNSFVLHAYYNYRQLLLLRYHQGTEETYYLGVPGIYYEREKRIALMFGFEGFENGESRLVNEDRRQAYAGCFGYYMKQVSI